MKAALQSGGLAALLGLTVACGAAEPSPQHEGPVPDLAGAHLECVYATPGHLGGLDEALAEGMQARLLGPDGALLATLTPDAAGRFSASHEAAAGEAAAGGAPGCPRWAEPAVRRRLRRAAARP